MTDSDSNDQATVIARYEDAKTAAGAYGFRLSVERLTNHLFVLAENGATVRTFNDMAHIEDFLRGVDRQRSRRSARKRPR